MKKQTIVMNDFIREYEYLRSPIKKAVNTALENGWYVLGKNVEEFEKSFAEYTGSKYCVSVANGYEAIYISLIALGIGKGDEVIVPTHSFIASALPVTMVGATPVFVECDEYFHIDPVKVEAAITKKTKAIMPVHLYGQLVDVDAIGKIARKYRLSVIEDACQAHGAKYKNKMAGSFGEIGCFSFYPTKNLGAFGDAGAITTNSKKLYKKLLMLRNYGQEVKYKHVTFGINSRLDELQAAILKEKLKVLDTFVAKRNKIAQYYKQQLASVEQITLPLTREGHYHGYHLFVVKATKRDALQKYLHGRGIQTMIHYPIPIHKQKVYEKYNKKTFPKTEALVKSILSLPLHPLMTREEVKKVCDAIKEFYEK